MIHLLTDGQGMPLATSTTPANASEREQVLPLLDSIRIRTGKPGRPRARPKQLAADKGYDSKALRQALRKRGIRPELPKRVWKNRKQPPGRKLIKRVARFVVERCFSWFQRKFRRLVVRWERKPHIFNALVTLGAIMIWLERLLTG